MVSCDPLPSVMHFFFFGLSFFPPLFPFVCFFFFFFSSLFVDLQFSCRNYTFRIQVWPPFSCWRCSSGTPCWSLSLRLDGASTPPSKSGWQTMALVPNPSHCWTRLPFLCTVCGCFHYPALGTVEELPRGLRHLLSGPSQEKIADPQSKS